MTTNKELIEHLKKACVCIYAAVDVAVADDINTLLRDAVAALTAAITTAENPWRHPNTAEEGKVYLVSHASYHVFKMRFCTGWFCELKEFPTKLQPEYVDAIMELPTPYTGKREDLPGIKEKV